MKFINKKVLRNVIILTSVVAGSIVGAVVFNKLKVDEIEVDNTSDREESEENN